MNDGQNGLQALEDELERDLCHSVHPHQEQDGQCQSQRVGSREEQDDINNGQHQLEPGVKTMDEAVAGEVLADGNISQHSDTPPFTPSLSGAG